MEALYQAPGATAAEVREAMADPPGYSTVRKLLEILESKGWLRHEQRGVRYVYYPTVSSKAVQRSSLRRVVDGLFAGSASAVVSMLIAESDIDDAELDRIAQLARRAKREGR